MESNSTKKFATAVGADIHRVAKARAEFNEEARENWAEGHKVMDDYVEAIKYEKSQEVVTKPTKANGWWGSIHYNNPQKIMDKWVDAMEADHELGEEWEDDFGEYMERVHESHEVLGKQVDAAWKTNGVKAHDAAVSAGKNFKAAWKAEHQNLAVDGSEVRADAKRFFGDVGSAAEAVRHTMRGVEKADRKPDREIDDATVDYIKAKKQIDQGYIKAFDYELKNTHLTKDKLYWSNKQGIVDAWTKPMEAQKVATDLWKKRVSVALEQKRKVKQMAQAEAKKVWPKKFAAVEKSWKELAGNFKEEHPHSLASTADVKADLTDAW